MREKILNELDDNILSVNELMERLGLDKKTRSKRESLRYHLDHLEFNKKIRSKIRRETSFRRNNRNRGMRVSIKHTLVYKKV